MKRAALKPSLAACVAVLTIVALFPLVIAFACTAHATFSLSPGSGLPGDTITVTNTSGFQSASAPVSKVVLRWNSSSGPILWSGTPNADGTLPAITFQVPSVPPSEGYTVIAYPYDANGQLMMNGSTPPSPIHSNAPFTVNAPPAAQSSAPAAQAPAAAAPAPVQASIGAGDSQVAPPVAAPPVAEAPVAPAPAAAGSAPAGTAGNQASGGTQKPSLHSPAVSTKPSGGSSIGIAIGSALVAVIVATTALLLVWIRRRRERRQPAVTQPMTAAPWLPEDRVSAPADLSGHAAEAAQEPSRAGDLVGAAPGGRPTDE